MFKNYRDVNFFDTGVLVKKKGETEFEILACSTDPDSENHYFLFTYDFDVKDIDSTLLEYVCKWAGNRSVSIDYTEEEWARLAVDCIHYGCAPVEQKLHLTKNGVIDFIDHGYIDEIEWKFYEQNFYETHRNCVVKVTNEFGQSQEKIYDDFETACLDFSIDAHTGWALELIEK